MKKNKSIPEDITHLICYQDQLTEKLKEEAENKNIPLLIIEEEFLSLLNAEEGTHKIISQYSYYSNILYEFIAGNQPLRILVADDDKINIELIKAILSEEFCHIDSVTDGEIALKTLKDALEKNMPYQLVYLDKHMPTLSGSEVIAQYRAYEKEKNINALFAVSISGDGSKDDKSRNLFNMHVGKPFNKKSIKETLRLAKNII